MPNTSNQNQKIVHDQYLTTLHPDSQPLENDHSSNKAHVAGSNNDKGRFSPR